MQEVTNDPCVPFRHSGIPAFLHSCVSLMPPASDMEAILALENGTFYRGQAAGAEGAAAKTTARTNESEAK